MITPSTISKGVNLLFLVIGFIGFYILSQKWRYRYYQWVGFKSPWVRKKLFKKLL
jgi:succinate dehydrogenase hydrophobic anchor subunit